MDRTSPSEGDDTGSIPVEDTIRQAHGKRKLFYEKLFFWGMFMVSVAEPFLSRTPRLVLDFFPKNVRIYTINRT